MKTLDPFTRQLVSFVRQMPDEALLELVRQQLLGGGGVPPSASANGTATSTSSPPVSTRKRPQSTTYSRRSKAQKEAMVAEVERTVKASDGMSLSDVAKATGEPKSLVQAALKSLKTAGRIHQAGDRRQARYAGTAKAAKAASEAARRP